MTVVDDFNRFAFERARHKYDRAQYDQMSTDDWCALVEHHRLRAVEFEEKAAMYDDLCD